MVEGEEESFEDKHQRGLRGMEDWLGVSLRFGSRGGDVGRVELDDSRVDGGIESG